MKRRDILLLLASSVFLVIAWITFSIIHQLVSTTINANINESIIPIQPTFDIPTINSLKTRTKVAPVFFAQQASPSAISIPTPTAPPVVTTPTPIVTIPPLSLFAPTPTASQGGTTP